jgi:hypothetical protein
VAGDQTITSLKYKAGQIIYFGDSITYGSASLKAPNDEG